MSRDDITLKQVADLHAKIGTLKTIGEWKVCVKEFATANGLTDREAIDIACREDKSEPTLDCHGAFDPCDLDVLTSSSARTAGTR